LIEHRCPACSRLLGKSDGKAGTLQIACPRCKKVRTFHVGPVPQLKVVRA